MFCVLSDLKLILCIMKVIGFVPIYTKVNKTQVGPPTTLARIYSNLVRFLVHLATARIIFGLSQLNINTIFSHRSTDNVNVWIQFIICILSYNIILITGALNGDTQLAILNNILSIDNDLMKFFKIRLRYNLPKTYVFVIMQTIISHIFVLYLGGADFGEKTFEKILVTKFYVFEGVISIPFIIYVAALLDVIAARINVINNTLEKFKYPKDIEFGTDVLYNIFDLHRNLVNLIEVVNECMGVGLLFFMGFTFYSITVQLYIEFNIVSDGILTLRLASTAFWVWLDTFIIIILSVACDNVQKEANKTAQILSRVYGKGKEYQNIIDKFLTKSIRQEIKFTAYGFFVIDNSTLFKIVSAVTTYLVILIQFKQLEDSKAP